MVLEQPGENHESWMCGSSMPAIPVLSVTDETMGIDTGLLSPHVCVSCINVHAVISRSL